ncbi:MAG: Stp1/IreP family PP2C-type Ser/Thr phosphatase [Nevskia sp.]|nr:Stp1/IreP family PP2C-type Ser/Thr phosphatase [Nevskia sp.]
MRENQEPTTQASQALAPVAVRAHGLTDIGMVRKINQDYLAVDRERGLFVVADGMGGHAAGDEASTTAVEAIMRLLVHDEHLPPHLASPLEEGAQVIIEAVIQAMEGANREIMQKASDNPDFEGMGTTAIVSVHRDNALFFGHIGDSRAYILRGHTFQQLTEDHSVVAQLVAAGAITPAEARIHPYRNVITRCLGMYQDIQVDTFYILLEPGDRVLLCTDGLTGVVPDQDIAQAIFQEPEPEKACRTLIDMANERGGADNITALLLYCE